VLGMLRLAGILRHLQIRLDLPETHVRIPMRESTAQQVLLNLIKNAIDAFAERPKPGAAIDISIMYDEAGGTAACRIADNAGGIASEAMPSIFEPYFTTKSAERGTGLGLFVVRHAMTEAGGRVEVQSTPGQGTIFTLHFPLIPTRDAAAAQAGAGPHRADGDVVRV